MYSATHDWGVIGEPRFERAQLAEMKKTCERHCYSTLNHIVGYGYNDRRVIQWLFKQALHGFQGIRGNFEWRTQVPMGAPTRASRVDAPATRSPRSFRRGGLIGQCDCCQI